MRIRTQFFITMTLFGLTLSVIAASALVTSREVVRLDAQEETSLGVGRSASELGYLGGDFILHREEQQRDRWQRKWTAVSEDASRLAPGSVEERAIVRSIESDLARIKEVFEDVAATSEGSSQALVPISWSRMAVQTEGLTFDTARLSRVLRKRKTNVQQRNSVFILTLVALFGAYIAANYFIVYRRALRSLAEVQIGTEIIGRGNLDHTIPVGRDDEVGDLSRAFNRMTADLKGVTASKSRLEEEIAEREAAQVALQVSMVQMRELSEARQLELSTTRKLLEAADKVAGWTNIEDLAAGLARILLKLTAHSRVTVGSWDQERRELKVMASEGQMPSAVGTRWPIDTMSTATKHTIGEQVTRVWDVDKLPEDEIGTSTLEYGLGHALYVPLVQRDDTVGMIVLDDPGDWREFSEREIELVCGIAAQAAVALGNARLFDAQRRIADRLQEALLVLPEEVPGIEFGHAYHSATVATRVGGDFYDLFELSHGQVGVVIGDVAGKGLNAAVLTSMVKNTVRAHANEQGKTPSQILKLTNDIVFKATRSETFVTVFFGILDCHDGRLVYSNAGHTTAALVHGDGTAEKLPATGPLLGAFAGVVFEEAETRLGSDELLLLYTDGLTEARRDGEFYGEERLFDLLASTSDQNAGAVVDSVIADVMSFSDNHLRDDLAMLSVRRFEPSGTTLTTAEAADVASGAP